MELNSEQSALKRDRSALVSELKSAGSKFKGDSCTCVFHEDTHPSAQVKQGSDGTYRFTCFVCFWFGDVFDVRAKLRGVPLGDVLKEVREFEPPVKPRPTVYPTLEALIATYQDVEAVYRYTNPETLAIELAVIRYRANGRKAFAQCSPCTGGWIKARPAGKLPLYNRARVINSSTVIVVEGEKVVHAITTIGHIATTSPMGAGKAHEADWTPLRSKTVYLWPDNDPVDPKSGHSVGVEHMKTVQRILETLDCTLYWIEPADLELAPKADAFDFIEAMKDGQRQDKHLAVKMVLDDARPLGAARDLEARLELIASGKWVNIAWPWPCVTDQMQALLPGTVTALCGEPGAGKSFWLLESFVHWHIAGDKVALFMLEDDRTYHLQRVLAQLEGNSNLTQVTWIALNSETVKQSFANQRDILNSFGRVLYDAPDQQVSLDQLADWFEQRCQDGVQISGIDSVTAAIASEKPWIDDQKFMFRVKETAKRYRSRLVYAVHPRISTGKAGATLSRLAGGAAYSRFSHSVAWLVRHSPPVTNTIFSETEGQRKVTYDRSLNLTKARNGKGAGGQIAFHLNAGSLRFEEHGMVVEREGSSARRGQKNLLDEDYQ